jgi:hypothetical protein
VLETVADAGLRKGAPSSTDPTPYPARIPRAEAGAVVYAADGSVIPDVKRSLYVGPSGVTTGQYGVFGSIVAIAEDPQGNRVVRRGEVFQESFAKYAYFTTLEGNIVFANNDQIFGPVHSDDVIRIAPSRATFFGPVSTAQTIDGRANGIFKQGFRERAPFIAMPSTADLNELKAQAAVGNMAITSTTAGNPGQASTRIEFVALDLNSDNDSTDEDEGFIKVYQVTAPADVWWVVADTFQWRGVNNGVRNSPNCGHVDGGAFVTFEAHRGTGPDQDNAPGNPANAASRACFLGGADILNGTAPDTRGRWLPWPGVVDPRVTAVDPGHGAYLWPINRVFNPNFRGVIYVDGKVAVSGKLRGRVTLAATGNIVIADDITYVTNPGAANCADILGLFGGNDIVVADNLLNDPIPWLQGQAAVSWDVTPDEFIDGFVLA